MTLASRALASRALDGAARALEAGALSGPLPRALSSLWASRSRACRPVALPPGAAVIGVGGPTLGGSFKTPLVLALAEALARSGQRVAVVAHGYRSRVRAARRVRPGDRVDDVGDEALLLCRELEPRGVPVVTGPRAPALALAARLAPSVIVDGLLQAEPSRLALSLLATHRERPFGAGLCPPAGDLRARPEALLLATDLVVTIGGPRRATLEGSPPLGGLAAASGVGTVDVSGRLDGALDPSGATVPLGALRSVPVGLVLAIARPERVVASLHAHGIFPSVVRTFLDHARPHPARHLLAEPVSAWLTTAKCATKLGPALGGAPVLVLRHRLEVPAALLERVREARPRPLSSWNDPW